MHAIIVAFAASYAAATAGSTTSTFTLANAGQAVLNGCQIEGKNPTYLRSGSPPAQTSATLKLSLVPSSTITGVTFAYTYVTGYSGNVGANFTVDVANTTVYNSPTLKNYPYGGVYSPPVDVAWSQSIAVPSSGGGTRGEKAVAHATESQTSLHFRAAPSSPLLKVVREAANRTWLPTVPL